MHPTTLPMDGGCRCGRVRFRVSTPPLLTMACHCSGCQRMTSGACSLSAAIPTGGFAVISGEPVVGGLRAAPAHHFFCSHCMSWLFTRMDGIETFVNIRPTMLDDAGWFAPYVETWTDEQLAWADTPALHHFPQFPAFDLFDGLLRGYASMRDRTKRKPTVVGDFDRAFAIMQCDGSAASFVEDAWRPGIAFDSRDVLNMSVIGDPQRLRAIFRDAADSLARSLAPS